MKTEESKKEQGTKNKEQGFRTREQSAKKYEQSKNNVSKPQQGKKDADGDLQEKLAKLKGMFK